MANLVSVLVLVLAVTLCGVTGQRSYRPASPSRSRLTNSRPRFSPLSAASRSSRPVSRSSTRQSTMTSHSVRHPQAPSQEELALYQRTQDALARLKLFSEQVDSIRAALDEQRVQLDSLENVDIPRLVNHDTVDNAKLNNVKVTLKGVSEDIQAAQDRAQSNTATLTKNAADQDQADTDITAQEALEAAQDEELAELWAEVITLQNDNGEDISRNGVNVVDLNLAQQTARLTAATHLENRKACESGRMTLTEDRPKAFYQYQTRFEEKPELVYGICGITTGLSRTPNTGYTPRSSHSSRQETPAVSLEANSQAYTTRTGVTVEIPQANFERNRLSTVDICIMSCTGL